MQPVPHAVGDPELAIVGRERDAMTRAFIRRRDILVVTVNRHSVENQARLQVAAAQPGPHAAGRLRGWLVVMATPRRRDEPVSVRKNEVLVGPCRILQAPVIELARGERSVVVTYPLWRGAGAAAWPARIELADGAGWVRARLDIEDAHRARRARRSWFAMAIPENVAPLELDDLRRVLSSHGGVR